VVGTAVGAASPQQNSQGNKNARVVLWDMLPVVSGLAPNKTSVGSNTAFPGSYWVCYLYYVLLGSGIIAGAVLWAYFFRHGLRNWTSA
jgi:hypothetical protein